MQLLTIVNKGIFIHFQTNGENKLLSSNGFLKQNGHFVSKKHRIERDSDNDTHDHDHDHHDDDHDHEENGVEPKQDDNHDDHDDHDHDGHDHDHGHDHGSTKKKTWTNAQKWGYATLANTFLGKNHIIFI